MKSIDPSMVTFFFWITVGAAVKDDLQLLNDVELHRGSTSGRPPSLTIWKRQSRAKIGILPNFSGGDGSGNDPSPSNWSAYSQADSTELCCPGFNVRNHRPPNPDLNDHNSVTCSIL